MPHTSPHMVLTCMHAGGSQEEEIGSELLSRYMYTYT